MKRPSAEEITHLLLGELTTTRASEIRRISADDPELAQEIADQEDLVRALAATPPSFEDIDLVAGVRLRLEAPPPMRPRLGVGVARFAAAALACSAALIAAVWNSAPTIEPPEFAAKGTEVDDPSRWAGVELYRAKDAERVGQIIGAREAILVAYRNAGPRPYGFLMVFLVDASGHCYWLYPAYVEADSDPSSVPIETSAKLVELPDAVTHPLPPGRVAVYALFSRAPLSVRTVEVAVSRTRTPVGFDAASPPTLGLENAAEQRRLLVVSP